MMRGIVQTGRTSTRNLCKHCNARVRIGDPRPTITWSARLTLTDEQRDLLLLAAAEYIELCEDAGELPDPVEFIDWCWPPVGRSDKLERVG